MNNQRKTRLKKQTSLSQKLCIFRLNPFMHNAVECPNILFLKYVWPFYNIMHERVKAQEEKETNCINYTKVLLINISRFFVGLSVIILMKIQYSMLIV